MTLVKNEIEAVKVLSDTFPEFLNSEFFYPDNLEFCNSVMHDFGNFIANELSSENSKLLERIAGYVNLLIFSDLDSQDKFLNESVLNGIFEPHGKLIKESKLYESLSIDSKKLLEKAI